MKNTKIVKLFKKFIDSQDAEANSKIVLSFLFALVLIGLVIAHMLEANVEIEWAYMLVAIITGLLAVDKIPEGIRTRKPNEKDHAIK